MKKRTIVTIMGGISTGGIIVLAALSDYFYRLGTARTAPKAFAAKKQAIDAAQMKYRQRRDDGMAWLLAQQPEAIGLRSREGLFLQAHWLPAKKAERTVVMMHGWRSSWAREFGAVSAFLHGQHCNLLLAEQRAHDESEGTHITFGHRERYDCLDWICKAEELQGRALPIYLYGVSMGASTVLMTSGMALPESVRGIIADCGYTELRGLTQRMVHDGIHLKGSVITHMISMENRLYNGVGIDAYTTLDAMQTNQIPVLFIHGTADDFVPLKMTIQNYQACKAPKELLIVQGAPHAKSYLTAPEIYQEKLLEFFRKYPL